MGNESSQRQEEDFYDPARKENISRRNKTRLELWEEASQRSNCCARQSPKSAWKVSTEVGSRLCGGMAVMTSVSESDATVLGRAPLAFSGCTGQCASTYNLYAVECRREIRAVMVSSSFSF